MQPCFLAHFLLFQELSPIVLAADDLAMAQLLLTHRASPNANLSDVGGE